jgi:hypothetical protein
MLFENPGVVKIRERRQSEIPPLTLLTLKAAICRFTVSATRCRMQLNDKITREHVVKKRLLELAQDTTRLTQDEIQHVDACLECLTTYAKSILQVARQRAKAKCRRSEQL